MKSLSEMILDSEKRTLEIDGEFYFVTEQVYQFFIKTGDKQKIGIIFHLGLTCGDITPVK